MEAKSVTKVPIFNTTWPISHYHI